MKRQLSRENVLTKALIHWSVLHTVRAGRAESALESSVFSPNAQTRMI